MLPHTEIRILLEYAYCLLFLADGAYLVRDKAMLANEAVYLYYTMELARLVQ